MVHLGQPRREVDLWSMGVIMYRIRARESPPLAASYLDYAYFLVLARC